MSQITCVASYLQAVIQFGREGGQVELQLDTASAISVASSTWNVEAQQQGGFTGGTLLIKPAPSQDGSPSGLAVLDAAMKSGLAPFGAKYEATWQLHSDFCVPDLALCRASSSSTCAATSGCGTLPMELLYMLAVACISCLGLGTSVQLNWPCGKCVETGPGCNTGVACSAGARKAIRGASPPVHL
eukprot:1145785-Pelagomonas_calceolata.AAC.1